MWIELVALSQLLPLNFYFSFGKLWEIGDYGKLLIFMGVIKFSCSTSIILKNKLYF